MTLRRPVRTLAARLEDAGRLHDRIVSMARQPGRRTIYAARAGVSSRPARVATMVALPAIGTVATIGVSDRARRQLAMIRRMSRSS